MSERATARKDFFKKDDPPSKSQVWDALRELFPFSKAAHLPAQNLVDCCAFFEGAFGYHLRPHLLHVQHERIQRLLDMWLLLPFLIL